MSSELRYAITYQELCFFCERITECNEALFDDGTAYICANCELVYMLEHTYKYNSPEME